jgi:hypothetical protein
MHQQQRYHHIETFCGSLERHYVVNRYTLVINNRRLAENQQSFFFYFFYFLFFVFMVTLL